MSVSYSEKLKNNIFFGNLTVIGFYVGVILALLYFIFNTDFNVMQLTALL